MAPPSECVEVRCAGCGETLEVDRGLTEFACPDCGMPQALPPELMPPRTRRALPLPGRGTARVPCGGCGAVLSVPHGLGCFACPLCGSELAASPTAAVSVVTPPAAVPITSHWPPPSTSEVWEEPPSRATHARQVQEERHDKQSCLEHTQGPPPNHLSFRGEPFSSLRAHTGTTIHVVGRAQSELANPSVHREGSHTKSFNESIARHGKKKSRFPLGPESSHLGKVEHPTQAIHAPQAQGGPSNYPAHMDQAQGMCPIDTIAMHGKQKTGHVVVPSSIEQEQMRPPKQVVQEQQADKTPSDGFHADHIQVEFASKTPGTNQKSGRATEGNRKRKTKGLVSSANGGLHLRRSKRLAKESAGLQGTEPVPKPDTSPDQDQSDSPEIVMATVSDPGGSSPPWCQVPQDSYSESGDVDATTPPASLGHGTPQAKPFPHCYSQLYPPEVRGLRPNPGSDSWGEHEMPQKSSNGTYWFYRSGADVRSNPSEAPKQAMHGQQALEASSGKNHSEQDARHGVVLSGSVGKSSKKSRGRAPSKLMEPRKEADRPILMPNGTDNWVVHPPCPKVASTISLLIKQSYPGTFMSVDPNGNGQPREQVVHHWHRYPSNTRATIMDDFLQRYKWAPGWELECQKIFDRKAVRQLVNHFCYEKQRAREELAVRKAKESLESHRASGHTELEEEDGREDLEEQQGDQAAAGLVEDDPLQWKPFVPEWMQPKWWEMLCEHWAKDEVLKVSYQKRKNRNAGNHPRNPAGSQSITLHLQLTTMENGRKPVSDIDESTNTDKYLCSKGEFVDKRARRTEEALKEPMEEASDKQLEPHLVWARDVGSCKHERHTGVHCVVKKAQIDSKSSPGCSSRQVQQPMFTQDQVQEMINQAMQGLNKIWEKRFQSLEQSMGSMRSSGTVPDYALGSSAAGAVAKECQLARQDTLDSVDGARDDDNLDW